MWFSAVASVTLSFCLSNFRSVIIGMIAAYVVLLLFLGDVDEGGFLYKVSVMAFTVSICFTTALVVRWAVRQIDYVLPPVSAAAPATKASQVRKGDATDDSC